MKLQEAHTILQTSSSDSKEEIKKKYKELVRKNHPDVNKEDTTDKLKKINEAYQVVTSGKSTDLEDRQRHQNPFHQQVVQIEHVELNQTISFKESILGCKRELKYNRKIKCQNCNGEGSIKLNNGCDKCQGKGVITNRQNNMVFTQTCTKCYGRTSTESCQNCNEEGFSNSETSLQVNIPGGVESGNILRLGSMGNYVGSFFMTDQYTDAFLHLNVTPEEGLSLQNKDVICTLNLSLLEALAGCKKYIKTIEGEKEIDIPSSSRHKEEVIIPNLGVERKGNQRVVLDVQYPNDLQKLINSLKDQ